MNIQETKSSPLQTWIRILWPLLKFSIAALLIAVPIRWFVAQPFLVTGNSMVPTIEPGDYLVLDKLWYHLHSPQRGDVIIMRYPFDPSVYFVKRIIGMPGEVVSDSRGAITILSPDGSSFVVREPYILPPRDETEQSITALSDDEYFVMGDNREQSSDSREWGPLQDRFIVGRAFMRLFPLF